MLNSKIYQSLVDFSSDLDKIRSKYMYSFSDKDILSNIEKINTKFEEMGKAYKEICTKYLTLLEDIKNNETTTILAVEEIYFKSLMSNILKGNLTILDAVLLIETHQVIRLDIDKYVYTLLYEN